ncbi:MAG: peptidylprolyl isomerase [Comamonas sp. SCN 67-35]|uniref:SurA N-terminal domain-containing protein n=1 Tax=unclassified Comamonas TaxID=2638500 RepID=UPI00086DEF4E|nr:MULTISPECIES: SurA N-terminal domain-containing protein [unclassified Comamonas]MBN9330960.1 SurA N-terminal domain-containing protein [Comamonas sp.]ODU38351.1 MAG: peptidylprolyl isomerase [Comamonas sp. SCN 67-35]OJW95414.1 MAG: peptidylprolyl isomerase [Burkholderiales bacterium 66-26]
MFEAIRKHSKVVMGILFLLIIPSFVLFGIDGNYFSGNSATVASVDGKAITKTEWDNAHRTESDRIRAQQPGIDGKLLDSPQARYATLEKLVRDRVLSAAARHMHLMASDAQLARELQKIPAIAQLRKPDGSLDTQAYRALVAAQGLTPEGFEAQVRNELSVNQVLGGAVSTSFASPVESKLGLDALLQRREIQIARFDAKDYVSKVTVDDAQMQAFYAAHPELFRQTEEASVEYVVLDLDAIKNGLSVSEDDLRTYYKENQDRLAGKEERRASHILINAPKDEPAAEREKARQKAEELLAQVRKDPSSFAELARKYSQDPGSAPQGGDLGFFARDAMVKPFADAVFAMKKGDISDVVETDFGYHIIKLTDVKTPKVPSFDEVRPKLEAELRQQQAQRKFAEVAETFSNLVYEQPDSLQPVADKLKLKIQTATGVMRKPQAGAKGALASPRFLEALFAPESIQSKRNTEATEIGSNVLVAGRITAYQPAEALPFDKAKDRVRSAYVAQQSAELARADGSAKLAQWQKSPDSATGLAPAITVSRDQPQGQPPKLVSAVLGAPADQLPAWAGIDLGPQGYAVAKIERIVPRSDDDAQQRAMQQQYLQAWTQAEALAYYDALKQRYKAQIKVERPAAQTDDQE